MQSLEEALKKAKEMMANRMRQGLSVLPNVSQRAVNTAPASSMPRTLKTAVQPNYTSAPVDVPSDFLIADAPDTQPVTITPVDWPSTPLPENDGLYAVVLENVLSPSECATLLQLAEASVPNDHERRGEGGSPWQPAMVNVGGGFEVLTPSYRNSDRIVWDNPDMVERLWKRCLRAPGLEERLREIPGSDRSITGNARYGQKKRDEKSRFVFHRVNERMRFLRYGSGQFFRGEFCNLCVRMNV